MSILEFMVRSDSAKALGWTLVHSLWEGAVVAFALAVVLAIARSSRVRYAAACLAMLGLLAGFSVTLYELKPREIGRSAPVLLLPRPANHSVDTAPASNHRAPWDASDLPPRLAPIWLAGVLLFQLRCLVSWTAAGRLRRIGVCGPALVWTEKLDDLRARLRMARPVTLLESCFAEVPVVIGHLRPIILMPVGLLAGLPPRQVEAILLHELAHIRRGDYLVNLMQTLVEGLLFYHPAVWWISGVIRTERENCCDDLVVLTSGDAHEYATALAALAENRWTTRQPALAATGGNLVNRIRRLLSQPEGPRATMAPLLSVGILVLTGAAALTAWQSPAPLPLSAQVRHEAAPAPATSPYDKWLKEEVVYIITDQERANFKSLQTDEQRKHFIEEFWTRRDPTPGTPENEYRDEHYRRIAFVNSRFGSAELAGWRTDRGRIYIQYGPPDEIDSHPSGGAYIRPAEQGGAQTVTYPFEMWRYRFIEGIGSDVILEFVDKQKTGEYRLTMDPAEKEVAIQRQLERAQHRIAEGMAEKQLEMAREHLRQMERSIQPSQLALVESEAQLRQAQKQLERAEHGAHGLEDQITPAQRELLESQTQFERRMQELSEKVTPHQRELLELQAELARAQSREPAEQTAGQNNSVFVSGSSPQAAVVILANRRMLVTVPIEFVAGKYSISISALASDGTKLWSAAKETSERGSHTIEGLPLEPGSYKLQAAVKDSAGPTEKTYVVNFSVK